MYLFWQRHGRVTMRMMKPGSMMNHLVRGRVTVTVSVRGWVRLGVRVRVRARGRARVKVGPDEAHEMQVLVSHPSSMMSVAARP